MALMEIRVPDIGDFDEVTVIELLVKPGELVKAEQSLITVESDKASMEIPSSHAGVVKEVSVKLGDKVKQGSMLLVLDIADVAASPVVTPSAPATPATHAAPAAGTAIAPVLAPTPAAAAPVTAAVPAVGNTTQVVVPDIGDVRDVTVIEVMVKVGDTIKLEQSLVTVESDKASMEIPSSAAGVIRELKVNLGDKVNVGDLLVVLETASPTSSPAQAGLPAPAPAAVAAASAAVALIADAGPGAPAPTGAPLPPHEPAVAAQAHLPHASPSVRKFARELGVPLAEVKGSGLKGRITESDVQVFTRAVMAGSSQTAASAANAKSAAPGAAAATDGAGLGLIAWPKIDFTKFGAVERKDMSRIKKITGANLHRNWVMIPHVTNHDDADITDLEAFRVSTNKENEKAGVKVTMLAFLIKACVAGLRKFPEFNASIDGDQLVLKQYYHIGFAADTPNGLMVPVIRDADKKGIMQISQEMGELAKKARDGKLSPGEMSGACFTISSLGGIGGRYFTPIINAPEVAILGVCKSTTEPVWNGTAFVPRLMLPLSLSWDHRVIDGAAAARFNVFLAQILGDFRRVLL